MCVGGVKVKAKVSRYFLLYFLPCFHSHPTAYCYCTRRHTSTQHAPAQLDQPSLSLSFSLPHHFQSHDGTVHRYGCVTAPAPPKIKGCRSVHAPPTKCSSFAKHLDYSAVGSLDVAKPCCHRPTATSRLTVHQTGVCQSVMTQLTL